MAEHSVSGRRNQSLGFTRGSNNNSSSGGGGGGGSEVEGHSHAASQPPVLPCLSNTVREIHEQSTVPSAGQVLLLLS